MKSIFSRAILIGTLVATFGAWGRGAWAVENGQGTNYVAILSADGIELGGEVRTAWPTEALSVGGTLDFRAKSNEVFWAPAFLWSGQLGTVRLQTDGGDANVLIVRSKWNDPWGAGTTVHELTATAAGVESGAWSSSWVSNDYRLGVVVTNFTTGTNLWWSIDCTRAGVP